MDFLLKLRGLWVLYILWHPLLGNFQLPDFLWPPSEDVKALEKLGNTVYAWFWTEHVVLNTLNTLHDPSLRRIKTWTNSWYGNHVHHFHPNHVIIYYIPLEPRTYKFKGFGYKPRVWSQLLSNIGFGFETSGFHETQAESIISSPVSAKCFSPGACDLFHQAVTRGSGEIHRWTT